MHTRTSEPHSLRVPISRLRETSLVTSRLVILPRDMHVGGAAPRGPFTTERVGDRQTRHETAQAIMRGMGITFADCVWIMCYRNGACFLKQRYITLCRGARSAGGKVSACCIGKDRWIRKLDRCGPVCPPGHAKGSGLAPLVFEVRFSTSGYRAQRWYWKRSRPHESTVSLNLTKACDPHAGTRGPEPESRDCHDMGKCWRWRKEAQPRLRCPRCCALSNEASGAEVPGGARRVGAPQFAE